MNKLLLIAILLCFSHSAFASTDGYTMGSATVDVTPAIGVPLAGYGGGPRRTIPWDVFHKHPYAHYLKPSKGVLDPIRSKALVLTLGTDRVLFLSLDVVGSETSMVNEIKAYAATLGINNVIVSATHTHSGPGAVGRNKFYAILATDRFVPSVYKKFMKGVKSSILQAAVFQEPVTVYRTDFSAMGFSRNRRDHTDMLDTTAHLLYGKNARNEIVGGFVNFGVHPTVLPAENLYFSADFAGGIERQLTSRLASKSTILFMNSNEGDVAPHVDGYANIEPRSAEFAELAAAAIPASVEVPRLISVRKGLFVMPKGKLRLANCVPKLPGLLKKLALGGAKWFPRDFELTHLQLGDITMMTWPGEPTVELGRLAQEMARSYGHANAWNIGLANGYMGYFLTETDYAEGEYEVCVSYHGPKAGRTLLNSHRELFIQKNLGSRQY